jgi:hypothetical protein
VNGWGAHNAERLFALIVAAGLGTAAMVGASSDVPAPGTDAGLDGLPIRSVSLAIGDVFDTSTAGPLRPLYRIANTLHIRTRESTVRAQLLFAPGDPWSERRAREQERLMRALEFLEPHPIRAVRVGDSVDVRVATRDAWTTEPEFNLERGGGKLYGSVGLSESNLLGYGKAVGAFYREDPSGTTRAIGYDDPAVYDTHVRFRYAASNGTAGASDGLELWRPFYAEDTRYSWGVRWVRTGAVARLYQNASEVASFERDRDEVETWFGLGKRTDGTVRRVTLSFYALDRMFGPSVLQPGAPPEFAGDEEQLKLRRVGLEGRLWRPHFVERRGVNRLDRIEDFDLGPSITLYGGYSPEALGSTQDEAYVQGRLALGTLTPLGFGILRATASSRLQDGPLEFVRRAEARWVVQPDDHTSLVLAAYGVAGDDVARDFQEVIGGLNGLRAYTVHAVADKEVVRLNAEPRLMLRDDIGGIFSFGVAAFYDAARAWGPAADGTPWFNDAGFGIRLAPPSEALGPVFRFDLAWPLSERPGGGREPVFSFGSNQAF